MTDQVLTFIENNIGRIRLNRPKAIHALTPGMCDAINTALLAQQLGFEHAMVYRAATELETRGYISSTPVGGASPALRLLPL